MWSLLLNPKVYIPVAAALGVVLLMWGVFAVGRSYQRSHDLQATIDAINQRDKINGTVDKYDSETLCNKLGGQWVSGNCE